MDQGLKLARTSSAVLLVLLGASACSPNGAGDGPSVPEAVASSPEPGVGGSSTAKPFAVVVSRGPEQGDSGEHFIRISLEGWRPNSVYGCQISTSDGALAGVWQRRIPTDANGDGDNESQFQAGTAWVWRGGGTVTVTCDGVVAEAEW